MKIEDILEMVRLLARSLDSDVNLTANRVEHIRVTARANEAHRIHNALTDLLGESTDAETADSP